MTPFPRFVSPPDALRLTPGQAQPGVGGPSGGAERSLVWQGSPGGSGLRERAPGADSVRLFVIQYHRVQVLYLTREQASDAIARILRVGACGVESDKSMPSRLCNCPGSRQSLPGGNADADAHGCRGASWPPT